jgi:hypothetical protein
MAYRGRSSAQKPPRQEERRALTPAQSGSVPGPFVVQWGRTHIPKVEFVATEQAVNDRLRELWDLNHMEAQGRAATWSDVVLYWQARS